MTHFPSPGMPLDAPALANVFAAGSQLKLVRFDGGLKCRSMTVVRRQFSVSHPRKAEWPRACVRC